MHGTDFTVFYDDGQPGVPRSLVSCSISEAMVTLEDGTVEEDVFEVTFNRGSGTPDKIMIVSC